MSFFKWKIVFGAKKRHFFRIVVSPRNLWLHPKQIIRCRWLEVIFRLISIQIGSLFSCFSIFLHHSDYEYALMKHWKIALAAIIWCVLVDIELCVKRRRHWLRWKKNKNQIQFELLYSIIEFIQYTVNELEKKLCGQNLCRRH